MTATATVVKRRKLGQGWFVTFTVAFTGTYASGGDVLDLSKINPTGMGRVPDAVNLRGLKGLLYQYSDGASDALGLARVFTNSSGGTNSIFAEHSNAACVAGATTDTVKGFAIWTP